MQALINQALSKPSSESNFALSMTSGNSSELLLDSAYGNHMALNPILTAAYTPTIHHTIYTASGSLTIVSQVGSISALNLSVSSVYQILNLAHNLLSVGQMTNLD